MSIMKDPNEEDFTILYIHSNTPYKQRMFTCMPNEFKLDTVIGIQPKKDFQETNLKLSTLPLPKVEN